MPDAVFFDLDRTLTDTAPDFADVLHHLQTEHGIPPTPLATIRAEVSRSVRGMLDAGFGLTPDAPDYLALSRRFLALYAGHLCGKTRLFDGMATLLKPLEEREIIWGIVTNKPEHLARPLVDALGLAGRYACVVGGDTTPRAKPFPDSLLHASTLTRIEPQHAIYVGDDLRHAGQAAGMTTLAARYGYLGRGASIDTWGAHHIINHPMDVLSFIEDNK